MLSLLARGVGHCGAVAVCLQIVACSLQNFDTLSSGAGSGGAGSGPDEGGASGDGGSAPIGGRAGSGDAGDGPTGGSAGRSGAGGSIGGSASSGAGGSAGATGGGSGGDGGTFQLGDGGTLLNLLSDPSFEQGPADWIPFGDASIAVAPAQGRDGSQCLVATGRTASFEGPSIDLVLGVPVVAGGSYGAEAWVRTSSLTTQSVGLTLKTTCTAENDVYTQLGTGLVAAGEWRLIAGEFTAATCALDEYRLYVEGPDRGVDLYVDDVGLYRLQ